MKNSFSYICLCLIVFGAGTPDAAQADFDQAGAMPYRAVSPAFNSAIEKALDGLPNKDAVRKWTRETTSRLPEFLSDMVAVSAAIEKQNISVNATDSGELFNSQMEPVLQFEKKWLAVLSTCPDCKEIFPLLKPAIEQIFADAPSLPPRHVGEWITEYLARVYQFLERVDPWRLGRIFSLEPWGDTRKSLTIRELSRETKVHGVKNVFVVSRQVVQRENVWVKFVETILNDQVLQTDYYQNPRTVLHYAAGKVAEQGTDPKLVAAMDAITDYMDMRLRLSWQKNFLDNFSYAYFFDQTPIKNEMIHVTHPLFMSAPHNRKYKVREYYREDNMNAIYASWGWDEYAGAGKTSKMFPESHIPQAADISQGQGPAQPPSAGIVQPQTTLSLDHPPSSGGIGVNSSPPENNPWTDGIFMPIYLFAFIGIMKVWGLW